MTPHELLAERFRLHLKRTMTMLREGMPAPIVARQFSEAIKCGLALYHPTLGAALTDWWAASARQENGLCATCDNPIPPSLSFRPTCAECDAEGNF